MAADSRQLPDHSGSVGTDTTPHYCAGCGRVGCVATWKDKAVARADEVELLREALIEIRDADPVDMALDPGWSARVAREALNGDGSQ